MAHIFRSIVLNSVTWQDLRHLFFFFISKCLWYENNFFKENSGTFSCNYCQKFIAFGILFIISMSLCDVWHIFIAGLYTIFIFLFSLWVCFDIISWYTIQYDPRVLKLINMISILIWTKERARSALIGKKYPEYFVKM